MLPPSPLGMLVHGTSQHRERTRVRVLARGPSCLQHQLLVVE